MFNYELGLFLTSINLLMVPSAKNTAYGNYESDNNETYRVYLGGLFEIFRPFNDKTGCNTSAIMEISLLVSYVYSQEQRARVFLKAFYLKFFQA